MLVTWETTLHAWMRLAPGDVFVHNNRKAVSHDDETSLSALRAAIIIITTPSTLVASLKTFVKWEKEHTEVYNSRTGKSHWKGAYVGIPGTKKHPLFAIPNFCCVIADEVQDYAQSITTWASESVRRITTKSNCKLALSGTVIRNNPMEMPKLCRNLNVYPEFLREESAWVVDKKSKALNQETVSIFHNKIIDRAHKSELNLPNSTTIIEDYDAQIGTAVTADGVAHFSPEIVQKYNSNIDEARTIIHNIQRNQSQPGSGSLKLFDIVHFAQQALVCPVLAEHRATGFTNDKTLYEVSRANGRSATIEKVLQTIHKFQGMGHNKIAVACWQTTPHRILMQHLTDDMGKCFLFQGGDGVKSSKLVQDFLQHEGRAVILLSQAGSVGITLCPGCEVMIFFGSYPWSPMDINQMQCRILRIGQDKPVTFVHLVPHGSAIHALREMHVDKQVRLHEGVANNNFDNFEENMEWQLRMKVGKALGPCDQKGNFSKV